VIQLVDKKKKIKKNKKWEKTKSDAVGESNFEKCAGTANYYTTPILSDR